MPNLYVSGSNVRKNEVMVGINTDTVLEAEATRLLNMANAVLPVNFKYARTIIASAEPTRIADRMHLFYARDHNLDMHATSVRFLIDVNNW